MYIGMVQPPQPQLGLGVASVISRGLISSEEDRVLQHLAVHRTSRNLSSVYRHEIQRLFHGISFLRSTRAVEAASLLPTWGRVSSRTLGNEWRRHRREGGHPREHRRLFDRIEGVGAVGRTSHCPPYGASGVIELPNLLCSIPRLRRASTRDKTPPAATATGAWSRLQEDASVPFQRRRDGISPP